MAKVTEKRELTTVSMMFESFAARKYDEALYILSDIQPTTGAGWSIKLEIADKIEGKPTHEYVITNVDFEPYPTVLAAIEGLAPKFLAICQQAYSEYCKKYKGYRQLPARHSTIITSFIRAMTAGGKK